MKKFICSLLFVSALCSSLNAQTSSFPSVKYNGDVNFGYGVGVGQLSLDRISIGTIQGVKIGDYFSTGLGIQMDYFYNYDKLIHAGSGELALPLYVDLRGHLPISPQASMQLFCDLGGAFGLTAGLSGVSGFYCTPGLAVQYSHFRFQVGYNIIRVSNLLYYTSANAIQLKIGYVF